MTVSAPASVGRRSSSSLSLRCRVSSDSITALVRASRLNNFVAMTHLGEPDFVATTHSGQPGGGDARTSADMKTPG
jgi:hypothetical protein